MGFIVNAEFARNLALYLHNMVAQKLWLCAPEDYRSNAGNRQTEIYSIPAYSGGLTTTRGTPIQDLSRFCLVKYGLPFLRPIIKGDCVCFSII